MATTISLAGHWQETAMELGSSGGTVIHMEQYSTIDHEGWRAHPAHPNYASARGMRSRQRSCQVRLGPAGPTDTQMFSGYSWPSKTALGTYIE